MCFVGDSFDIDGMYENDGVHIVINPSWFGFMLVDRYRINKTKTNKLNRINVTNVVMCCGCMVCVEVCPQGVILKNREK